MAFEAIKATNDFHNLFLKPFNPKQEELEEADINKDGYLSLKEYIGIFKLFLIVTDLFMTLSLIHRFAFLLHSTNN